MSDQQETRGEYEYLTGWPEKKIICTNHGRAARDFFLWALKKLLVTKTSVLLQKKSKKGVQKADKTQFSFLLSFRTYELGTKQEA